jgi:hypothetical protein
MCKLWHGLAHDIMSDKTLEKGSGNGADFRDRHRTQERRNAHE